MSAITTQTKSDRRRGRKIAAVLAGGLVLGVGTMTTVASWNDSEFAAATFTAGFTNPGNATFLCLKATADSTVAQASTSTITGKHQAVFN